MATSLTKTTAETLTRQATRAAAERDLARGQAEAAGAARREAEIQRDAALTEARAARDRKDPGR